MDLNFFGKQGSGKGTQAQIIADRLMYKIFETGAALRGIAKEESDLGKKVKDIMNKGDLVSTQIVMEVLEDFLKKISDDKKVIFDGIPRSMEQKSEFDSLIKKYGREVKNILIDISDDEAVKRLSSRRICEKCGAVYSIYYKGEECENCQTPLTKRSDDTPEAITRRLEIFRKETLPIIESYEKDGSMVRIDGTRTVEGVSQEIMEKVLGDDDDFLSEII